MELVTYLAFDGDCEAAFKHYEQVLGGKILMMMRISDMPEGLPIDTANADRIMHVRLQVGSQLLMGGDSPPGRASKPQGFCAHIKIDDPGEAERIFRELGAGGTVTMKLEESFWARRFGMLTDRFGVPWMVNCEKPMGEPETSGKPFVASRTFDTPLHTLWQCFTDPERMAKWWGPKGAGIVHSEMDLRPGGTYLYGMKMPDGKVMWGRQVFREIDPQKKIVLVNAFSDQDAGLTRHPLAPSWPIELLSTFDFEAAGPGRSTFTVIWTPIYPTPDERNAFDAGHDSMKNGWGGTLDQLAAYLAKN
jgi:uncharacterized glyoxalase superfamily protein PhnB